MRLWHRAGACLNRLMNCLLCLGGTVLLFWSLFSVDISGARWVLLAMGTGLLGAGGYFFWREEKSKSPKE